MAATIVVIEDDEPTREGLLLWLADAGYRTIGAATLREANKVIAQHNPDLLIVDVRLGGDNGLQLIAMAEHSIPAIVITAFADPSVEAEAHQLGADFLVKPFLPATLLELVRSRLSKPATVSPRRWPRRVVNSNVAAHVGNAPARIIDVGYGGACLEVRSRHDARLPPAFWLTLPGRVSVGMNLVWNRKSGDNWQCGVAVDDEYQPVWRELVDALA